MTQPTPQVAKPVPIAMIESREQRFVCNPYRVTLLVKGCVERQAITRAGHKRTEFARCVDCELGREVEARSGGPVRLQLGGVDSIGRPKGGWHANHLLRKTPPKQSKSRPADFVGDLPPCAAPGCPEMRMRCGSTVPGGDPFCKGHRLSLAKRLSKERREVSESEAAAPAPNGKAAMHSGIARAPEAGAGAVASVSEPPKTVFDMARPLKPPPLRVIEGGRVEEPEPTIPAVGDSMASAIENVEEAADNLNEAVANQLGRAISAEVRRKLETHDTDPPVPAAKTDPCPPPAHVRKRRKPSRAKTFADALRDAELRLVADLVDVARARRRR